MVNLLRRLFIRNYRDLDDPVVRQKHGLLASGFGIFTNALLVLLKAGVALILWIDSGFQILSVALLADAANNLTDMASSLVTLISFKISLKPADEDHPFGHQRSEYVAGLIVSIIVCSLAVLLFEQSLTSAIEGAEVTYDILTIVILAVAVLLKLGQGYVYRSLSKIIGSTTLKASSLDSLTDSLATSLVLVSAIVSLTTGFNKLDAYMGLAVSLFILYSGIKMVKEASSPLLGEAAKKEDVKKVVETVMAHQEIMGVHDLIIHDYGPSKRFCTLHAEVSSKDNIMEIHEVIDDIEKETNAKYGYETTIHLDPIAVGDPLTDSLKETVIKALKDQEGVSIHDFRIVKGKGHTNVIFDVLLPFKDAKRKEELLSSIQKGLDERKDGTYCPVVTFDTPYVE